MTDTTTQQAVLLVMPSFFGYEADIAAELDRQGYATIVVDERPSNGAFARAVMRARKDLIRRRIDKYYRSKLAGLASIDLSLVIVIKGEIVPRWFLDALRARSPKARFVYYTFDAIQNASNCIEILDCFDQLLSFDRTDVAAWRGFEYLPLFYVPDFSPLSERGQDAVVDHSISFVGTLHSERYQFVKKLTHGRSDVFTFFFVQARWYFLVIKYLTRKHEDVAWTDVSFTPLSRAQIANVIHRSHAVLDMQRAGQAGLTMRTFEVLATGAILVTTNRAIMNEPFYDPRRVIVVPPDVEQLDAPKVTQTLGSLERPLVAPDGFERYSLASWVRRLVGAS